MTRRITRDRHALLSAVVVVIAITTTGCHVSQPNPPTPSTEATKALDQLKSLPSLEDTTTQVQAAIDEITAAASKVILGIVWTTAGNEDTATARHPTNRPTASDTSYRTAWPTMLPSPSSNGMTFSTSPKMVPPSSARRMSRSCKTSQANMTCGSPVPQGCSSSSPTRGTWLFPATPDADYRATRSRKPRRRARVRL
jgi:Lipoprotein confined to pathogenic Mycobacterium